MNPPGSAHVSSRLSKALAHWSLRTMHLATTPQFPSNPGMPSTFMNTACLESYSSFWLAPLVLSATRLECVCDLTVLKVISVSPCISSVRHCSLSLLSWVSSDHWLAV